MVSLFKDGWKELKLHFQSTRRGIWTKKKFNIIKEYKRPKTWYKHSKMCWVKQLRKVNLFIEKNVVIINVGLHRTAVWCIGPLARSSNRPSFCRPTRVSARPPAGPPASWSARQPARPPVSRSARPSAGLLASRPAASRSARKAVYTQIHNNYN